MTFTTFQKSGKQETGSRFVATFTANALPSWPWQVPVPFLDRMASLFLSHTHVLSLSHTNKHQHSICLSLSLSLWQVNVPFLDLMASLVEGIGGVDGALPLSLAFSLSLSLVLPPLSL
jgi:hypothetical protein